MTLKTLLTWIFIFCFAFSNSQTELTKTTVEKYTRHFTIDKNLQFSDTIAQFLKKEGQQNQFVGLAEVHQSQQLSHFTSALLRILHNEGYSNFALEIGDHSASIIEQLSKIPSQARENLKRYNNTYGKGSFPFIPFIFVDKVADAQFIEEAAKHNYNLWGIDREYEFSYLMHLDNMYELSDKGPEIQKAYDQARKTLSKMAFKDKIKGQSKFCWLVDEPTIGNFFQAISTNTDLHAYTKEIENSWKIYCRFVQGKGGSNARALYMRRKFDSLYNIASKNEKLPKVLVKLGGVHLTRGNSQYGRHDVGRHLHEKAKEHGTGYLAIRHVWRYKNGKDQVGKKGWEKTSFLMQLGKKDQWTLIDLRPLRVLWEKGEITVDKGTAWELKSYDLFLISPDDTKGKINK